MLRGIVDCVTQGSGKLRITRRSIPAWITSPCYLFYMLDINVGSGVMAHPVGGPSKDESKLIARYCPSR